MQSNLHFIILFKEDKKQFNNTVPLYIRITIDGRPVDISTKRYVNSESWHQKSQKMGGKSEEARSVNTYLKTLEHQVFEVHRMLISEGKTLTAETLKNEITGVDEIARMLQQVKTRHNTDIKTLIGKGYTHATWVKYNTSQKHITDFLKWKYNISDINIKELNFEFLTDFEFYLQSEKNIDVNTVICMKMIKKLQRKH